MADFFSRSASLLPSKVLSERVDRLPQNDLRRCRWYQSLNVSKSPFLLLSFFSLSLALFILHSSIEIFFSFRWTVIPFHTLPISLTVSPFYTNSLSLIHSQCPLYLKVSNSLTLFLTVSIPLSWTHFSKVCSLKHFLSLSHSYSFYTYFSPSSQYYI